MNKQSKRSVWLVLLCVIMVLCMALTFVACDKDKPDDENKGKLTFDVNAETTISYYEYCTVPVVIATDDSGNTYFPKVEVKDSAGNVVALEDGKFFVTKDANYTFTYSLSWNGETVTKTTIAKVVDSTEPSITPTVSDVSAFVGDQVTVPSVDLDDNKDSDEQIKLTVKVVHGSQEVAVADNKFTPTEAGVYNIVYTATDSAGNVATKTVPAYVIAKVDGEIAYFYENGSIQFASISNPWGTTLSYTTAGKYPLSTDGKALSVFNTQSPSGVEINNPIVADISGYSYFYVDVYNPMDENVKFYINYIWNNNYLEIAPKQWTRVVAQKNSTGDFELLKVTGKISGADNDSKTIFGSDVVQPNDIKSLKLGLLDANQTIYLGSFRAVNELPALPDGIVYATAPKVTLASANCVLKGSTQKVEFAIEDGGDATLDVKVSVNGADAVAVDDLDAVKFDEVGEYVFTAVLTKNGKQLFKGTFTVVAIESNGNEVLFTGNKYGLTINGIKGWWSSTVEFDATAQVPGEATAGATKVTSAGIAVGSYLLGGLETGIASIADVSSYKYIYFDVYNPQDKDIDFIVGYDYGYPVVKIYANHWTRIVLEVKEDGIYVRDAYTDQQGGSNKKACIKDFSFNTVAFASRYLAAGESFLIGNVYAVNELPELPTGIKYNWNPVVEFDADSIVTQGSTKAIGVTVTNNDDNLAYTLKVSVNGAEAVAVTGDYTFTAAGQYKFICEFTRDGKVVYTAEHSVYAIESTGNEVLFTGNQYGNQINQFVDWFAGTTSYDNTVTAPGATSAGVLKLTAKEASTVGAGFYAKTASITNVSGYKYVYFDVYNAQDRDVDFVISYAGGYPVVKLYANHWTRIVLEVKEDGVYVRDAYTDQYGGTNKKTNITNFNFSLVEFAALGLGANEYLYFGNVYAVNELPELPTGVKYNWTTKVSFTWPESIEMGDSVNITVNTQNAEDAVLSITVEKNGAEAVAVTNGSAYTFDVAGTYKFVATVTLDGTTLATATKTITIVDTSVEPPDEDDKVLALGDADGISKNGVTAWQNTKTVEYDSTILSPTTGGVRYE